MSGAVTERKNEFWCHDRKLFSMKPWDRKNQSFGGLMNWTTMRDLNHLYEKFGYEFERTFGYEFGPKVHNNRSKTCSFDRQVEIIV